MALIKHTDAAALLKDAIVLDLGDLGRQGEKMRQAAEARARQIVDEARSEVARLTREHQKAGFDEGRAKGQREGREQGLAEGRAEAAKQAAAQFQQIQQAWIAAAGQWDSQRQELENQARQAVLQLAVRMAEKIVHRAVEVDPALIERQLSEALAHVLKPMDVAVRINPADRPALEQSMPDLLARFPRFKHLQLTDDPRVKPGGCVVAYGQGQIDATIDTQLVRIAELILPQETA